MMPDWFLNCEMNSSVWEKGFDFCLTSRNMFGLLNPAMNSETLSSSRLFFISVRTVFVAVAVSAMTGVPGNSFFNLDNCLYSGRKSCPHCEMQCASSMAKSTGLTLRNNARKCSFIMDSGATYNILIFNNIFLHRIKRIEPEYVLQDLFRLVNHIFPFFSKLLI